MNKYRKKPVVIEAFQMTESRRWDNSDWPEWLNAAWQMHEGDVGAFYCDVATGDNIFIATLEGHHKVTYGDWIIRGVKGELYPCKPDIFEATYEEVSSDEQG